MKRISIISAALTLASCGGNSDSKNAVGAANNVVSSGNPYADIAGVYQDTLPCKDCPGTLTELTLHPDSTFILREKMLNAEGRPGKSANLRGVFSFVDGTQKIKLTSSQAGAVTRTFEAGVNGITASDVQASAGVDLTLELRERIMGKIGPDFISYKLEDKGSYPTVVFTHMPGSDIVINKPALDRMKDSEKAVVLYYAMQFNSGCDDKSCALEAAMNTDKSGAEASVRKWMPSLTLPSADELRASRIDRKLVFLNVNLTGNQLSVNCNTMSSDYSMAQSVDVFELGENEVKLVNKGKVMEQKRQAPPQPNANRTN
jgi:uncharacterized lipoprotein NlpE involved in copper resistance